MKKYVLIFSIAMSAAFYSCKESNTTETKQSEATTKNLKAVEEINKAIQSGDVSTLDQYLAADAVDHASPMGDIKGADTIKAMLSRIHTMGTDMKMEVIKTLADDEYVFQWMRITGTTATADFGMPIGTKYDMNAIQVSRFQDGKAVEHWEFMQPTDMAKMMGPQGPSAEAMPDSAVTNTPAP
jgi:limonene-1,2-epoxide hydrolase